MDAPAQALWNKADTSVDTTPSLPVKRREIIRSRLSLLHTGGGRERGRIIQKLIISRIGFLCPLSVLAESGYISLWLMVEIFNCTRLTDMHPSKAANRQVGELDSYCFYHISWMLHLKTFKGKKEVFFKPESYNLVTSCELHTLCCHFKKLRHVNFSPPKALWINSIFTGVITC